MRRSRPGNSPSARTARKSFSERDPMRRACDNPFAVDRVLAQRYRVCDMTWEEIDNRFERLGRRAAIIGAHGRGKTTLLEDFTARLAARGWSIRFLRFDDRARTLGRIPPLDPTT